MGYFALPQNTHESDDLNNLECSFDNFKLLGTHTTYKYLIEFSLTHLNEIRNYQNGIELTPPTKYNQQIYDTVIDLYLEMLSSKVIYKSYIEYIKSVLKIISSDILSLDELVSALSKYVHVSHISTCHNLSVDSPMEYLFTTDNHKDELSTYLFENIHPSKQIIIHYYDNEKILYTLDNRSFLSNENWLIERLNYDYLIPTFELDMSYSFKNKIKLNEFICKNTLEETLESFYQLIKKKDSKVHMSLQFNTIYYFIKDIYETNL